MSPNMLRITIEENPQDAVIKLEGRIAGPWVAELNRVWVETAPQLAYKNLALDLRSVTYADNAGTQVLRGIYAQTGAQLVSGTPWTQFLAEQITRSSAQLGEEEL
jgi:anti-anti-sigma regulatory factor